MSAVFGLLLVALGSFVIWRLEAVYDASAEIRDRWLISTRLLGDLNNFTSDYRAAEASHLLASKPADMAQTDKEIVDLDGAIERARGSYGRGSHDGGELALWNDFNRHWAAYRTIAAEVVRLSSQGRKSAANELYLAQSRVAYDRASDALGALTDRTVGGAKRASDRAEEIFQQTRSLIVVAIAVLVLLTGLVMRYLVRKVLGPILTLAAQMRALAADHTEIETPGTDRRDEIGEMARAIVVFRDNAIELAHSQRGLEQQALMLAEKLETERQFTELQRNFVSMASHEFRTPLTVIDGQAQRLARTMERGAPPAEHAERIQRIRMAVRRMTNLTDRLLDSLQLFEGKAELYFHPQPFDLFDLLHDVCQTFRDISPGSQIVERLRHGPRTAFGDPRLLYQAFSNLLSNAVKYSPAGSLVELSAHAESGIQVVVVADRGMGIPQSDREHLFERYHRGENARGIVGTGIGLYFVKMVVDLHGGSISVESEVGKGSRFTVRLPEVDAKTT